MLHQALVAMLENETRTLNRFTSTDAVEEAFRNEHLQWAIILWGQVDGEGSLVLAWLQLNLGALG